MKYIWSIIHVLKIATLPWADRNGKKRKVALRPGMTERGKLRSRMTIKKQKRENTLLFLLY